MIQVLNSQFLVVVEGLLHHAGQMSWKCRLECGHGWTKRVSPFIRYSGQQRGGDVRMLNTSSKYKLS